MKKISIITSKKYLKSKINESLIEILKLNNIEYEIVNIDENENIDIKITNSNLIISVGGDGTASECAKELIGRKTGLAVIPSGSGNGFAYHFGVKRKINEALKQLHSNKFILIDSCKINNQKFINVSGLGFDAHIANLFASNKKSFDFNFVVLFARAIASAAAVGSSSNDAFEISKFALANLIA